MILRHTRGAGSAQRVQRRIFAPPNYASIGLGLLLAGALLIPLAVGQDRAGGMVDGTRSQLKQLQMEREQLKQRLDDARSIEQETLGGIEQLSQEVRKSKKREDRLRAQRRTLNHENTRRAARIKDLRTNIERSRLRIGDQLRRMYRLSKLQDTTSLISLAQYKTYFKDNRYLQLLSDQDRDALAGYQALGVALKAAQAETQKTLAALAVVIESLAEERESLAEKQQALAGSLGRIRENQELYGRYIADLNQSLEAMATAIERMEARRKQAPAVPNPVDPKTLEGTLPAPVSGRVVAEFGRQDPRYALKKFQRGIVIRVAEDASVHAVAAGVVVHAGPFRGYQELVVLDHGQGFFSVYGHLERLAFERGESVQAGDALGRPAYQPVGEGYDVYFEVRLHGKPQDPELWLKPGSLGKPQASGQN